MRLFWSWLRKSAKNAILAGVTDALKELQDAGADDESAAEEGPKLLAGPDKVKGKK